MLNSHSSFLFEITLDRIEVSLNELYYIPFIEVSFNFIMAHASREIPPLLRSGVLFYFNEMKLESTK